MGVPAKPIVIKKLKDAAPTKYRFAMPCSFAATCAAIMMRGFLTHGIFSFFLIAVIASSWIGKGLGATEMPGSWGPV